MNAPILCQQVREVDRIATEELGMPGLVLMENAGRGVAQRIGALAMDRVLIACGPGNNGGDGFVIARHLDLMGLDVHVLLCSAVTRLTGDAQQNYHWLRETSVEILDGTQHGWDRNWQTEVTPPIIVDAILGTGAKGQPRSPIDTIIDKLNRLPSVRRFAVDLPSGLDGDTGLAARSTFRADETITFVAAKAGLLQRSAKPYVGELRTIGIGVPRKILERLAIPVEP